MVYVRAYIHTQKNLGLGIGFGNIPIPNTQNAFYTQKLSIRYWLWVWAPKKCVLGIRYVCMIPIPNIHSQYTQFLGIKYNFGFGYWVWVYTQTQIFMFMNVCVRDMF